MTETATRLFSSYSTWSKCLACNPKDVLERNRSDIFRDFKICKDYHVVFVAGSFPKQLQVADQESSPASLWTECAIAWKMLLPSNSTDGTCWKSTDHFSTLPYGWIPHDGAEFFALFVCRLKENWLEFCATGQERLSRRVSTKSQLLVICQDAGPHPLRHAAKKERIINEH
jgi:hypothetical protein